MVTQLFGATNRGIPKPDFSIKVTPAGSFKERSVKVANIAAFCDEGDIDDENKPEGAKTIIWVSTVPVAELPEDGKGAQFTVLYVKEASDEIARKINGTVDEAFIFQQRKAVVERIRKDLLSEIDSLKNEKNRKCAVAKTECDAVFDEHFTPSNIARRTAMEIQEDIQARWFGQLVMESKDIMERPPFSKREGWAKLFSPRILFEIPLYLTAAAIWPIGSRTKLGQLVTEWSDSVRKAEHHRDIYKEAQAVRDAKFSQYEQEPKAKIATLNQKIQRVEHSIEKGTFRLSADEEQSVREHVLGVMRRRADPDFYVFADNGAGLYMNQAGDVDPVSHEPTPEAKSRNPLKIGRIRRPWDLT